MSVPTYLHISTLEQENIRKNGLLCRNLFGWGDLIIASIVIFSITGCLNLLWTIGVFLFYGITGVSYTTSGLFLLFSIPIIGFFLFSFILGGFTIYHRVLFLPNHKIILGGKMMKKSHLGILPMTHIVISYANKFYLNSDLVGFVLLFGIGMVGILTSITLFKDCMVVNECGRYLQGTSYAYSAFLVILIMRQYTPLSRFVRIGEKLQSSIPKMENHIYTVRGILSRDINFNFLHTYFEKLAKDFSHIINLTITLEKIEKYANKGELFDSTQFINSRKENIKSLLTQLRGILISHKEKLLGHQIDIIGLDNPELTLAGERSDIILTELTKYIEILDTMIRKL